MPASSGTSRAAGPPQDQPRSGRIVFLVPTETRQWEPRLGKEGILICRHPMISSMSLPGVTGSVSASRTRVRHPRLGSRRPIHPIPVDSLCPHSHAETLRPAACRRPHITWTTNVLTCRGQNGRAGRGYPLAHSWIASASSPRSSAHALGFSSEVTGQADYNVWLPRAVRGFGQLPLLGRHHSAITARQELARAHRDLWTLE